MADHKPTEADREKAESLLSKAVIEWDRSQGHWDALVDELVDFRAQALADAHAAGRADAQRGADDELAALLSALADLAESWEVA